MPYISKKDREIYSSALEGAVGVIFEESSPAKRAEMIGWWANHLVQGIVSVPSSAIGTKGGDVLKQHADEVLSFLLRSLSQFSEAQVFALSGNLNYCISYVLWRVLGGHASYGMRCYAAQQIRAIADSDFLKSNHMIPMIVQGVIHDVLAEVYRRKTAAYEDAKIVENGDLF